MFLEYSIFVVHVWGDIETEERKMNENPMSVGEVMGELSTKPRTFYYRRDGMLVSVTLVLQAMEILPDGIRKPFKPEDYKYIQFSIQKGIK